MAVILIHITNFYIGLMRHTFKIALLFIYIFNGFILSCNTGLPTSKKRVQIVHFHIYKYMYVSQLRVTLTTFSKKKIFLPQPLPLQRRRLMRVCDFVVSLYVEEMAKRLPVNHTVFV